MATPRLPADAITLLETINQSPNATTVDPAEKKLETLLAERLLVFGTDVHTPTGAHEKRYRSWTTWAERHDVGVKLSDEVGRWPNITTTPR